MKAELQHVEDFHADGSLEEASGVWTQHDPPSGYRNVFVRVSFIDHELAKWARERPGDWTITLTPPSGS